MRIEQFTGSLLGLAIGDALGYPAEFRTREKILSEIGPQGITDFISIQDPRFSKPPYIIGPMHPPGTYTDDTQMSLAVARGLLAAGHEDLDTLMGAIGRYFVNWSKSFTNDRSPGSTCMTGCQNLEEGMRWRESGVKDSKGCGSAMRVSPVGLFYSDLDDVAAIGRDSSILTHGHDAAIEGAAAAALLVAYALRGDEPGAMFDQVMARCGGRSRDFDACMNKLPRALREWPPEVALSSEGLGESWVAEEAVASALYCVASCPDSYSDAVLMAVNTDGDSDSIAAITGSIMGARLGVEAIPRRWTEGVEDSALLIEIASALHGARR